MLGIPESWQPAIVAGLVTFLGGILLEKYRNRLPNLQYYLSSSSDFKIPPQQEGQNEVNIYTHSIVINNTGRAPATDIEIVHHPLKDKNFWHRVTPDVSFTEEQTPDGGLILKFDRLLPKISVTIHYLYIYPHSIVNIHNYVKCNEVAGIPISILHVPQSPKWLIKLISFLALLGSIYLLQLLWVGLKRLIIIMVSN